tara:strand:+ start:215 stop:682 length:468 start_codon:yes stop_codon:yes gene_type:complete
MANKRNLREVEDSRNDGMGAVTIADNVEKWWVIGLNVDCFLCDAYIHDGDKIYIDLEHDQAMHYSHVGERIDYGVWMGVGIDLKDALIVDDGVNLGYLHPKMEKEFGLAYPGQVHYEHLGGYIPQSEVKYMAYLKEEKSKKEKSKNSDNYGGHLA